MYQFFPIFLTYRCSDPEISNNRDYPTFTRMEPPDTQATNSTLALLEYYKWKKFSIVTQKDAQWQTIAKHLRYQAEIKNFTINHYEEFVDYRTCCNKGLNCCTKVSSYKTFYQKFLFVLLKLLVQVHTTQSSAIFCLVLL